MAMKWIPLDGKKDPPANRKLLIANKEDNWREAFLARIEFNIEKEYVFKNGEDEYEGYTHYMVIDLPKDKDFKL